MPLSVNNNFKPIHPMQFTLRSMLVAVFAISILVANRRGILLVTSALFWPATIGITGSCFLLGRSTQPVLMPDSSGTLRRSIAFLLLFAFLVISAMMLWVRYRWLGIEDFSFFPVQPFPYPDEMLLAYHHWLDVKYPAPRSIKIHGECETVRFTVNVLAWVACSLFGFQTGLVSRNLFSSNWLLK